MKTYNVLMLATLLLISNACVKKNLGTASGTLTNASVSTNTAATNSTLVTKYVPVSEELKKWGLFQVGSYWIVRDSTNARQDSVYVTNVSSSSYTATIYPIKDTLYNYEIITVTLNMPDLFSTLRLCSLNTNQITTGEYITVGVFALDSLYSRCSLTDYLPNGYLRNQTISCDIGGQNYSGVRYIHYCYSRSMRSAPDIHASGIVYWKKGVGVVKRRGMSGPYTVIRYNIVQ